MTDMSQHRFAEYATSGAFNISLTRRQVGALSLFATHDSWSGIGYDSLERKGLISILPQEGGRPPVAKITAAGIKVAGLCSIAGLTNAPMPDEAREIDALHAELAELRRANAILTEDSFSLYARAQELQIQVEMLRAEKEGGHFPKPMVTLKDPKPERRAEDMLFLQAAENDEGASA